MNIELNFNQEKKYNNGLKRLLKGEPIQYVLGKVNFYGYDFKINKNVLIPRFETEHLVSETINYINKHFKNPKVIDLGCGSGVIGITIKKEIPTSLVTCLDIDNKALKVAKENSLSLGTKIDVIKGDMLKKVKDKYDVIISNPPYISKTANIEPIVLKNEPHRALFAENDGLFYYKQILKEANKILNSKSLIAFEIGCTQAKQIISIAKQYFPQAKYIIKKDLTDKDRYIFILNNI